MSVRDDYRVAFLQETHELPAILREHMKAGLSSHPDEFIRGWKCIRRLCSSFNRIDEAAERLLLLLDRFKQFELSAGAVEIVVFAMSLEVVIAGEVVG